MRNVIRTCQAVSLAMLYMGVHGQVTTPRTPSPAAEVSQTIGISRVTVNYSRPSVKGREIWGKLVPYGWNVQAFGAGNSAPWRAGANENTTITFSHDAKVEGQNVPAGTYGLFYVINSDNTGEVILSKDNRSWGSFFYDQKNDQLRSKIKLNDIANTDLLTYDFSHLTKSTAELDLNWEKKQFPVKIEFDVDRIVIQNAAEELKGQIGFNWQNFATAAAYSMQNKIDMEQGMKWADQAIAQSNAFQPKMVKSGLLKQMGKTAEAEKIISDAIATSTNAELNAYAYQVMAQGDNTRAIELFKLNTKRFPTDPNTFDSLGEGYYNAGDKQNAITSFKKALSMNPPQNVRVNSEKFLKEMGAL